MVFTSCASNKFSLVIWCLFLTPFPPDTNERSYRKPPQIMSLQLRSWLCIDTVLGTYTVEHILCLSDVNECEDPGVCGTAQCENKEGSYDCLCDIGYIYDNETKSCVGKCVYTHNKTRTQRHTDTEFRENWVRTSSSLSRTWCSCVVGVGKGMQRHLEKFCISRWQVIVSMLLKQVHFKKHTDWPFDSHLLHAKCDC